MRASARRAPIRTPLASSPRSRRRPMPVAPSTGGLAICAPGGAPAGAAATHSPRALERLVGYLPPKERACVLLKDVFDYSLEETAELVDSTVGGVKAALNRGRGKLEFLQDQ